MRKRGELVSVVLAVAGPNRGLGDGQVDEVLLDEAPLFAVRSAIALPVSVSLALHVSFRAVCTTTTY